MSGEPGSCMCSVPGGMATTMRSGRVAASTPSGRFGFRRTATFTPSAGGFGVRASQSYFGTALTLTIILREDEVVHDAIHVVLARWAQRRRHGITRANADCDIARLILLRRMMVLRLLVGRRRRWWCIRCCGGGACLRVVSRLVGRVHGRVGVRGHSRRWRWHWRRRTCRGRCSSRW